MKNYSLFFLKDILFAALYITMPYMESDLVVRSILSNLAITVLRFVIAISFLVAAILFYFMIQYRNLFTSISCLCNRLLILFYSILLYFMVQGEINHSLPTAKGPSPSTLAFLWTPVAAFLLSSIVKARYVQTLSRELEWKNFKVIGASIKRRRIYVEFLILDAILRLFPFIDLTFILVYITCWQPITSLELPLSCAFGVLCLLLVPAGVYAVEREYTPLAVVSTFVLASNALYFFIQIGLIASGTRVNQVDPPLSASLVYYVVLQLYVTAGVGCLLSGSGVWLMVRGIQHFGSTSMRESKMRRGASDDQLTAHTKRQRFALEDDDDVDEVVDEHHVMEEKLTQPHTSTPSEYADHEWHAITGHGDVDDFCPSAGLPSPPGQSSMADLHPVVETTLK